MDGLTRKLDGFNAAEATEGFKRKMNPRDFDDFIGFNAAEATEGFKRNCDIVAEPALGTVSMQPKPQKGLRVGSTMKWYHLLLLFQCSRSHRRV